MRHYFFFIVMCIILRLLAGCSTSPMPGEGMMNAYLRETNARQYGMFRRSPSSLMMPVEASGCDLHNPLAICLKNTTTAYQARCWVGEMAQPFMTSAGVARAPIATQSGIGPAYLIPPGAEKPVFVVPSNQSYRLKCQLFRGAPPDDNPPYIITHQMNLSLNFNGQEGRTFHLHPDHMFAARGLPTN